MIGSKVFEIDEKTAMNSERARRRRNVARTIGDARDRLTSATGTRPSFDYEMTLMYARNRLSAAYTLPLFAGMISIISCLFIPVQFVVIWLGLLLLCHALLLSICHRFENAPQNAIELKKWRRHFIFGDFLYGLCWGSLFFLPMADAANNGFEVFQFATMLVVIAMTTMLSFNLMSALFASTLPITLASVAVFAIDGQPLHFAMAAMASGSEIFMLMLGIRLNSSSLVMLEYRAEKDWLFVELEQAKAVSDESRRRAEEANLAKSRFLATMSHELRTPLNAILGFSEVMQTEVLGPINNETYKGYVSDIHTSGKHLLNLINEILDLSRVEAGKYTLNEESIHLGDVAQDCCHLISVRAKSKGIVVHERYEDSLPRLWADERAIRQVILNILSNAVKFTPSGGEIWVTCGWTTGGSQYLKIRDTGPGIPEEEIPIVTQAFGQGAIAHNSAEDGTGLGLSIVQALINMHEGKFELHSKLREGTEVIVTLPRKRVLEAMPPIEGDDTADQDSDARKAPRGSAAA